MNFKKFISGISALTIAASAFAGLTVTANAYKDFTGLDATKTVDSTTLTLTEGTNDTRYNRAEAFTTEAFGADQGIGVKIYNDTNVTALTATLSSGNLSVSATQGSGYRGGFYFSQGKTTSDSSQYLQFTVNSYSAASISLQTYKRDSYVQLSESNAKGTVTLSDLGVEANDIVKVGYDTSANVVNYYVNGSLKKSIAVTDSIQAFLISRKDKGSFSFTISNVTAGDYTAPTRTITKSTSNASVTVADSAKEGTTVSITGLAADTDYENPTVSVVDGSDKEVSLTEVEGGYTFTMPDSNVTVTASASRQAGYVTSGFTIAGTITGTNITDANGVDISVSTTSTEYDTASIQPVSWDGKAIAFTFTPTSANSNSQGDLKIVDGSGSDRLIIDYYNGWRIRSSGDNTGSKWGSISSATEIVLIQDGNSVYSYINGKKNSTYTNVYSGQQRVISGIKIKSASGTVFGMNLEDFRIMDAPATYAVTGGGVAGTYISGTDVTLGAAEEGYDGWSIGDTYYAPGDTYRVTSAVDITAANAPAAGPMATVDEVVYQQFPAEATISTEDENITAAKVLVNITGTITRLGLQYTANGVNWLSADKDAGNISTVVSGGNIVLGAILPGLVEPTTASFKAVVD